MSANKPKVPCYQYQHWKPSYDQYLQVTILYLFTVKFGMIRKSAQFVLHFFCKYCQSEFHGIVYILRESLPC